MEITEDTPMAEIVKAYPGALLALAAKYHGGYGPMAFLPDETLKGMLSRYLILDVKGALEAIRNSRELTDRVLVEPRQAREMLESDDPPELVDVRSEEEHRMVRLEGARHLTRQLAREIAEEWPKDRLLLLYCHRGERSLEAATYFESHGLTRVKAIRGGIDAWSAEVDPLLPRYGSPAASSARERMR